MNVFYILINIANEIHSVVVLCILYHISMDDQWKSMFTYTDCIPTVSWLTVFSLHRGPNFLFRVQVQVHLFHTIYIKLT